MVRLGVRVTPMTYAVARARAAAVAGAVVTAVMLAVAVPPAAATPGTDPPGRTTQAREEPPGGTPPAGAPAEAPGQEAEARTLAERYAPVVVVRTQPESCGAGEPYAPSRVEAILGRPDVALRRPGRVVAAPTAADLFGAPAGSNLDLPGTVLDPGCDYERWSDRIGLPAAPTVYARVVTDTAPPEPPVLADVVRGTDVPDGPRTVVQYWFWWVYNDWNDRHEGDWEMVQLVFDAPTPEAALGREPELTAYAQHEGSEVARWGDDDRVAKVDGRPVVYPGQGSHAAYYTQAVWFGRSAATGFGCDDTTAPGTALRPAVVMLPAAVPTDPSDPFAWLAYPGRWGQQAPSFNNGPTGPAFKEQWAAPLRWVEERGRAGSVSLPPVPGVAADGFCGMVSGGSRVFLELLRSPSGILAFVLVVAIFAGAAVRRTRWRGGDAAVVDRERHTGQILVDMGGIARRLRRHLLPVSLAVFVAGVLASYARQWAVSPGADTSITEVRGTSDTWLPVAANVLAWGLLFVVQAVAVATVTEVLHARATGADPGLGRALRHLARRPAPALTYLAGAAVLTLLSSSFWLLPVALAVLSLGSVAFVASTVEGLGVRASVARSIELTRTRRLKSTLLALVLLYLAVLTGPVVGGLLLLGTGWPVAVCNALAAAVSALLVPVPTIGMGLLFHDLRHEAAVPRRSERRSERLGERRSVRRSGPVPGSA